MIRREHKSFILDTKHTTYCFRVMDSGHLEHLYYGRKITTPFSVAESNNAENNNIFELTTEDYTEALTEKITSLPGNTIAYDDKYSQMTLEDIRLEMSSYGKGDIREPFIEVVHSDGSFTSDFLFEKAEISKGKKEFLTLPGSYDEKGNVEHLCVTLKDSQYDLLLELHYYVYEDCDVITRSSKLINHSEESVQLLRLMSTQIDFDTSGYIFTTFHGAWSREMTRSDVKMESGKQVNASYTGTSSSRANPFVMLSRRGTTEDFGECYGLNLIYSGNHYEAVEVNGFGKTRIVSGINPQSFCYRIGAGESFETPEAVMTYSHEGFNGMSQHMHQFVREHIVRGVWKQKTRPVLLNSWEAAYFDINEEKLLRLAKAGKEAGIELFVMDDGWFGNREDDTQSLGDWEVNRKKLPNGVSGLCEKIKALGLEFGIWVEPEMVNVKSRLYEKHPDWVLQIPKKPHSEGRTQRILDLTKKEVQDYMIEKMSQIFSESDISYVKWDMNRIFSDYYSDGLLPEQQGEAAHRYVLGLYRCMKELTNRFPDILFEGCCSGGNRFDLGILCYFPQIWASDNTDAVCRAEIQTNYSYGYPMSVAGSHVSASPNHQTQRSTPLSTRFHVACFGIFGYECNLCDMTKEERETIKEQIAVYKEWRDVLQKGSFYRGRNVSDTAYTASGCLMNSAGNITEWTCVSEDKKKAVGFIMQKLTAPNTQSFIFRAKGLQPERKYHFYNKGFEEYFAYGDALMYGGVRLQPVYKNTLNNAADCLLGDFGSRLYFMEEA